MDSLVRRLPPHHALTIDRVTMIAVNIEVMIPIIKVIEKPFMGPVPTENKIKPTKKVVILASNIVENALS